MRHEAGIQVKLLNDILHTYEDMGRDEISVHDKLKEFAENKPLQVLISNLFINLSHIQ